MTPKRVRLVPLPEPWLRKVPRDPPEDNSTVELSADRIDSWIRRLGKKREDYPLVGKCKLRLLTRVAPSIFRNRGRHISRLVRKIAGVAERREGSGRPCR